MTKIEQLRERFRSQFGQEAVLSAAPGRVNIIGEHTDYNMGWVLPGAIDKRFYVALAPNGRKECRAWALDYDQMETFDLQDPQPPSLPWLRYIYGEARELQLTRGFDVALTSEIPVGAGISSSAAFTSGLGLALNEVFDLGLDRPQLAKAGQLCEHHAVGVRCGIMDQFASLLGKQGAVIQLDCRSLEYHYRPFEPEGLCLLLLDTQVKHSLAGSAYNERRRDCETGVEILQRYNPHIHSLRDASLACLEAHKSLLDERVYRRCHYVITENARVEAACAALDKGDYKGLGRLMMASHEGLSREYEVSCAELDFLQSLAIAEEGVLGSRMMGGGFGGCTINLIQQAAVEGVVERLDAAYEKRFWKPLRAIAVNIGQGARVFPLN